MRESGTAEIAIEAEALESERSRAGESVLTAPTAKGLERTLAVLADRLNPILVKEVRQALRGRWFRYSFWLTLFAAMTVGITMLGMAEAQITSFETLGTRFCFGMFACLSVAVHFLVPFSAYHSMGSEWDENTFDLLVLSDMKPRQIVLGKLLSAGAQALLVYSAFGPFLVFAFLMGGVDLLSIAVLLGSSALFSMMLSTLGICFSSLTRLRYLRLLTLALAAATMIAATGVSFPPADVLLRYPDFLRRDEFWNIWGALVTAGLTVTGFAFAVACARLAHPEENRSTALRVLTSCVVVGALSWMSFLYLTYGEEMILLSLSILTTLGLTAVATLIATEPEPMGRRVRLSVPRNPILALLASPWMPGGSRGFVFLLLHLGLVFGALTFAIGLRAPNGTMLADMTLLRLIYACVAIYVLTWVGIPSAVFSRSTRELKRRVAAAVCVPFFAAMAVLLPFFYGAFTQDADLSNFRHLGNPASLAIRIGREEPGVLDDLLLVGVVAGIAVALNVPRIVVGFREVLAHSATRRRASVVMEGADA